MLDIDLLLKYGAVIKKYPKGAILFSQDEEAKYYFQVVSGEVRMNNYNNEGKEFIQGIFKEGKSFGEPPLFIDRVYPANAEVTLPSEILLLEKSRFLALMGGDGPGLQMMRAMARRLYFKATVAAELSYGSPEHRILTILNYFKKFSTDQETKTLFKVDFTRKEIANLTGLRVETVIRAIKSLEQKGQLKIIDGKVWMPF
ncbi:MAG: cyclic nucleotide-binding protein [Maribacter sp.]|nr:MAG: cyclic nucleotide-binding protein [Maribacter sp.]